MKSTFGRQFLTTAAILLVAVLLLGSACAYLVREHLLKDVLDNLYNDAQALSSLSAAYASVGRLDSGEFRVNLTVAASVSDADALIFNSRRTAILCSCQDPGCQHLGRVVNQEYYSQVSSEGMAIGRHRIDGLYDETRYVVSVPILLEVRPGTTHQVGMVMVSTPTEDMTSIFDRISEIFLTVTLLVMALVVIAATVLTHSQAKPLAELASTAIAFGHGDLKARARLGKGATEEMDEVALAFNNMADAIEKSEYQRQEFVANVSHELKTPMTTIGGYIDGILDGTIPPEKQRHYMQIVSDETKRLSRLVRSMLEISRVQDAGGISEEKKTRFDACECMGQVLITFEQKINSKQLDVDVRMPEHALYTRADRDAITQVMYNLLDNAVKFCTLGGVLGVRIQEGGDKIYISVSNEGETIPPEELPLVFDRFHKLDKSRSQNLDGWGLGLYIVRTIVCSHGENISVTSRDGKTEFTFTLPLVS